MTTKRQAQAKLAAHNIAATFEGYGSDFSVEVSEKDFAKAKSVLGFGARRTNWDTWVMSPSYAPLQEDFCQLQRDSLPPFSVGDIAS